MSRERGASRINRNVAVVLVFIAVAVISIIFILLTPPLGEEAGEAYYLAIDDVRLAVVGSEDDYEVRLYIRLRSTVGDVINVTNIIVDKYVVKDFKPFNVTALGVEKYFVVKKVRSPSNKWGIGSDHVVTIKYVYKGKSYTTSISVKLLAS